MTLAAWITLLLTWTVAVIAPGPDFVAVLRVGAVRGRRAGVLAALGVATGMGTWIVLALTGLAAILRAHEGLYAVLRLAGAGFLVLYGSWILWSTRRRAVTDPPEPSVQEAAGGPIGTGTFAAYRLGLATNLSNPKALAFFGAFFGSLVPRGTGVGGLAEVALVMVTIGFGWFAVMAWLSGAPRVAAAYRRAERKIDRVVGTVFVGIGGALAPH